MKRILLSSLLTIMLLTLCQEGYTQNSYSDFKSYFKPNKHLLSPDNTVVYEFQKMDMACKVRSMEEYINKGQLKYFSLIIISIDRNMAGAVLDRMKSATVLKGMSFLADKWALDVVYFVSENTFNSLSELAALKNFKVVSSL
jgi:hypothetical protein